MICPGIVILRQANWMDMLIRPLFAMATTFLALRSRARPSVLRAALRLSVRAAISRSLAKQSILGLPSPLFTQARLLQSGREGHPAFLRNDKPFPGAGLFQGLPLTRFCTASKSAEL